jgi:hypothetical protein
VKKSEFKALLKEEIKRVLTENMFEVGEEVMYMGEPHRVFSDNGYVVKLISTKRGTKVTLNYSQAKEKIQSVKENSEFDIDKIYKAKLEEPNSLKDLELGATYEIEYGARDVYGDKDTGTTKISITQKDLSKYDKNTSIQNYLTDQFNMNPETGEDIDTGYRINQIKSVKKL